MLNKSLMFAALVGTLGYGTLNPAHAQGLPPDDGGFEIETADDSSSSAGFLENLGQYVGVTLGANGGTSDAADKTIQGISLEFDLPRVANIKTALSVDVGSYENIYTLELRDGSKGQLQDCQGRGLAADNDLNSVPDQQIYNEQNCANVVGEDGEWLAASIERTIDDSFSELTEGYVQWEPTSFATLRVGRQPIVLGQFDIFSPLMFATPLKSTGTKTKTTKADKAYAQDGLQVSLFPTSNFELSMTSIPEMRIDPASQQRFEDFAQLKGGFINFAPTPGASGGQVEQVATLRDISESDLSVVRAMYFGDRFTFGVTQIEGAETNDDPLREARLKRFDCADFFASGDAPTECANSPYDTYALDEDEGLRFGNLEAMAIELSYRVSDRWTFILERTLVEGELELDALPDGGGNYAHDERFLPIYQQLVAENQGKPYVNVDTIMQGVGMVYKGDRWLLNLQVVNRTQEGATAKEEAWRKGLDRALLDDQDEDSDDTLPILNAVRLLGDEKQGYAGFGFGSFGQNFGFGLSAGWRYFEKLEVGFFGGMALDVTGAEEIETEGYESAEGDGYASFGINYLF